MTKNFIAPLLSLFGFRSTYLAPRLGLGADRKELLHATSRAQTDFALRERYALTSCETLTEIKLPMLQLPKHWRLRAIGIISGGNLPQIDSAALRISKP